jgi:hypothetical protein
VRASEPIVADAVYTSDFSPSQKPVPSENCHKARRGQAFRVQLTNRAASAHGKKGSDPRYSFSRVMHVEGANRSGFVTVSFDIPLVGLHAQTRFFLAACVLSPHTPIFGYHQDRSPGNTQAPLHIHEAIRGPGLQVVTVRRDNGDVGAVRRIHTLDAVPALPAAG